MQEYTAELVFDPNNLSVNQSPLQCFHYHSLGHRCGSPAMRGEYFCYHHRNSLKPAPVIIFPTSPFELPPLTCRAAILSAADEVASRIAANSLDLNRARSLLYAIHIASLHLPPEAPPEAPNALLPAPEPAVPTAETILSIEIEQTRGLSAPAPTNLSLAP